MASRRQDLGSWLEGTPDGQGHDGVSRLGLPAAGRGSLGSAPRRVGALGIDWLLSMAVSAAFAPVPGGAGGIFAGAPEVTLAVFAGSTAVLVGLLGHTIGHRLLGLQVVRLRDLGATSGDAHAAPGNEPVTAVRPPGLFAGVVRTVLLCLVIPAAIWDRDRRGMHDAAAGTAIVRR